MRRRKNVQKFTIPTNVRGQGDIIGKEIFSRSFEDSPSYGREIPSGLFGVFSYRSLDREVKRKAFTWIISLFLLGLIVSFIIIITAIFIPYISDLIYISGENPASITLTATIATRIIITSGMAIYLLIKYFRQEERFLNDARFLIGMFFIFLIAGKYFDLYWYIWHESPAYDAVVHLALLKFRYIVIIANTVPLVFMATMVLGAFVEAADRQVSEQSMKRRQRQITMAYALGFGAATILLPWTSAIQILLIPIALFAFLPMVVMLNTMRKAKGLHDVNTSLGMVGFLLYFLSTVARPLITIVIGSLVSQEVIQITAEIVDLIIHFLIFLAFLNP